MMKEKLLSSEALKEPMTVLAFAEANNKTALAEYIHNALDTYKRIGLSVEDFRYSPDANGGRVEVALQPKDNHEGHVGIVHGGFLSIIIDASSGALAMILVENDEIAFTKRVGTTFHDTAFTGIELKAISHISTEETENKREIKIVTDVLQGGVSVASATVSLTRTKVATLERLKRQRLGGVNPNQS